MHVSRVAVLLLRAARRSRRPLAIAVVSLMVAGICVVTDVSGAALAAEQPGQAADASASSGSSPASAAADDSAPAPSSSSQSGSSTGGSPSTPATTTSKTTSSASTTSKTVKKAAKAPANAAKSSTKAAATTRSANIATPTRSSLVAAAKAGPALTLSGSSAVADSNHDGRTSVGDVVTTTWKVKNGGTDPATGLTVTTTRGSATCATSTVPNGSSTTCTSTTKVTQADLDAAKISITGTAKATILAVPTSSAPATAALTLSVKKGLTIGQSITRVSDRDRNGRTSQGDLLQFVFTVRNTGSQTLHNVQVIDQRLRSAHVSVTCSSTTLAPNKKTTCRSQGYQVTAFQARQGFVVNYAQARGTTPSGAHIFSGTSKASTSVMRPPPPPRPRLSLVISVAHVHDADGDGKAGAGDTVTYAFSIRNVGNTRISNISLTDKKLSGLHLGLHCGGSVLPAGTSTRCTADPFKITAFNVGQKQLVNFASVRGVASTGRSVGAFDKITLGLSGSLTSLVGSTGLSGLPRTGGTPTTPLTIGFWMVILGFGLVLVGRRGTRPATAPLHAGQQPWQLSSRPLR